MFFSKLSISFEKKSIKFGSSSLVGHGKSLFSSYISTTELRSQDDATKPKNNKSDDAEEERR